MPQTLCSAERVTPELHQAHFALQGLIPKCQSCISACLTEIQTFSANMSSLVVPHEDFKLDTLK